MESEQAAVLLNVMHTLQRLGIIAHVGGSVASSVHGIPRFTQDIDIVAALRNEDVPALVQAFEGEFYVDRAMISDAIRRRASFNLIHLDSLNKVDIFVPAASPWAAEEASRRLMRPLYEDDETSTIAVSSPEDIILHKLQWFQMGNHISDRQWQDVLGVLKVQAASLDHEYLRRWASDLGLADLLKRAVEEAA